MAEQSSELLEQDKEAIPVATLMSASEFSEPDVKTWQLGSFKAAEQQKQREIKTEVIEKLREQAAPEIAKQAEIIKKEAFEQAQKKGFEQGLKQGVAEGLEQGRQQAAEEAEKILSAKIDLLDQLISAMEAPYQMIAAEVYESLVFLATEVAKKIVETELKTNPEQVLRAVHQAIEVLPDDTVALTIELHPQDLEQVEAYRQEYNKDWHLQPSDQIAPGACRVKHDASIVENSWQKQLADLLSQTLDLAQHQVKTSQVSPDLIQDSE